MQGMLLSSVAKILPKEHIVSPAVSNGFLTPQECAAILQACAAIPEEAAVAGYPDVRPTDRSSRVKWIYPGDDVKWIYDRMDTAVQSANAAYQFDLIGFLSGIQLTRYSEGDYYDWHLDIGGGDYSSRKLSLTVQLSDPDTYEGGNLEFMFSPGLQTRAQGSITVFPSYLPHRVTRVNRGTRYSLVTWVDGPPFR
jgi:PKHD-type hydroxylase